MLGAKSACEIGMAAKSLKAAGVQIVKVLYIRFKVYLFDSRTKDESL